MEGNMKNHITGNDISCFCEGLNKHAVVPIVSCMYLT